jgi:hypothetical protein
MNWEELKSSVGRVYRAKVPGGWLVMIEGYEERSLTFYPDANHSWDGKSLD